MKQITWGILGTGSIASQFAEGLAYARGASIRAVASRSRDKAQDFSRRFGVVNTYDSYEVLCADPNIDIVYVATPNEFHYAHCLLAIGAGKAVLCEKPFTLDASQAQVVFAAARKRNVFCMEAMWMRCSEIFRRAVETVRTGSLGDAMLLSAQLGFANAVDPKRALFLSPGGGALLDLGVYPIALAQAMFGRPDRVQASAVIGPTGVDTWTSFLLEFSGGAQATISASICGELANCAEVSGTRGRLRIHPPLYFPERLSIHASRPSTPPTGKLPGLAGRARQSASGKRLLSLARSARRGLKGRSFRSYSHGTGLTCEAEEAMNCLRSGLLESTRVTHQDTLQALEIADSVRRVWRVGKGPAVQ
jgi:predicted dehydrogenase